MNTSDLLLQVSKSTSCENLSDLFATSTQSGSPISDDNSPFFASYSTNPTPDLFKWDSMLDVSTVARDQAFTNNQGFDSTQFHGFESLINAPMFSNAFFNTEAPLLALPPSDFYSPTAEFIQQLENSPPMFPPVGVMTEKKTEFKPKKTKYNSCFTRKVAIRNLQVTRKFVAKKDLLNQQQWIRNQLEHTNIIRQREALEKTKMIEILKALALSLIIKKEGKSVKY